MCKSTITSWTVLRTRFLVRCIPSPALSHAPPIPMSTYHAPKRKLRTNMGSRRQKQLGSKGAKMGPSVLRFYFISFIFLFSFLAGHFPFSPRQSEFKYACTVAVCPANGHQHRSLLFYYILCVCCCVCVVVSELIHVAKFFFFSSLP